MYTYVLWLGSLPTYTVQIIILIVGCNEHCSTYVFTTYLACHFISQSLMQTMRIKAMNFSSYLDTKKLAFSAALTIFTRTASE